MDPEDRFAAIVRSPSPSVHLDVAAGLIGVAFEPQASVDEVVSGLDQLAETCEPTFEGVLGLFRHHLTGNSADYGDPRNSYLHQVLHRGLGIPITLSICAVEVGRRVGVPIRAVGLPGHFMVACDDRYADPFHAGHIHAAGEIEAAWRRATGLQAPFTPDMLVPPSQRLVLLRMLNNLKNTFVAMDDPVPLRTLARLRSCFPELAHERAEYDRWLRHWN